MIKFDHIFLFSSDIQKSSLFLSSILGLPPAQYCGADMDILRLDIDKAGALQYHYSSDDIPKQHIAFQVDIDRFDKIANRLRLYNVVFGNDPEDQPNMQTSDFLGGYGRVFFSDQDGNLFEVIAEAGTP